jgi:sister-chromatid-cohesion protein PDS5
LSTAPVSNPQVDQVETRLKAIDLLGRIFCIPDDQAATEYKPLYHEFVNRFNDKNVDVRAKMVQWTQNFLPSAPDAQAKEISGAL